MNKYLLMAAGMFLMAGCNPTHQPSAQQIVNGVALEQARQKCGVVTGGMSEKQKKKVYSCINTAFRGAGGKTEVMETSSTSASVASAAFGNVEQALNRADRAHQQDAFEKAYSSPLNKAVYWKNAESGHRGSVTPVREGRQATAGTPCRQFKSVVTVGDKTEETFSSACGESNGTWSSATDGSSQAAADRINKCKLEVGNVISGPFSSNPNEHEANKLRKRACEFLPYDTSAYLELERQAAALLAAGTQQRQPARQRSIPSTTTTRCQPDSFGGGMTCRSQ